MTRPARSRPRGHRGLPLRLWLLLGLVGLAGCFRGCPAPRCSCGDPLSGLRCGGGSGGPTPAAKPGVPCGSGSCDDSAACLRGVCRGAGFAAEDELCRSGEACREHGACGADYEASFLGLSNKLECVAVDAADCRATPACAASGLCSLGDAECAATSDADCAPSARCASHDECTAVRGKCKRDWTRCDPYPALAAAPAWAPGFRVLPEKTYANVAHARPPEPGAPGALACRVSRGADFDNLDVRVGARCAARVGSVDGDFRSAAFVLPDVVLGANDAVSVALSDVEFLGGDAPGFGKARYLGTLPFRGALDGTEVECLLVAADAAALAAAPELATADRALAEVARERPSARTPRAEADALGGARAALARAAAWLGWSHAELAGRVTLVETARADWQRRLGELHEHVWAVATPRGTTLELDNGLRVELRSVVCGDPVRASLDRVHSSHLPTPDCAIELAVENRGSEKAYFRDRPAKLGDFVAQILRPKDGGAVLETGACLTLYRRGEPPSHTLSLDVGPAQHAVVRLVSEQAALAIGSGRADERVLVVLGDGKRAYYLRAD